MDGREPKPSGPVVRAGRPSRAGPARWSTPAELPRPPAPQLQTHPREDLDRLHAEERERLTTYGWADRERRIARMPIERAMKLLAERGIDGWPSPSPP